MYYNKAKRLISLKKRKALILFIIVTIFLTACGLVTKDIAPLPSPESRMEAKLNKAEQQAEDSDSSTLTQNEDKQTDETTANEDTEAAYIGNVKSKRFHRPSCHLLPAEKNRTQFKSREQAVKRGYIPCGKCHP